MNYKHIYRQYLTRAFEEQACDMERAITYLNRNFVKMPHDFRVAHRELTSREKNSIICDMCLPF